MRPHPTWLWKRNVHHFQEVIILVRKGDLHASTWTDTSNRKQLAFSPCFFGRWNLLPANAVYARNEEFLLRSRVADLPQNLTYYGFYLASDQMVGARMRWSGTQRIFVRAMGGCCPRFGPMCAYRCTTWNGKYVVVPVSLIWGGDTPEIVLGYNVYSQEVYRSTRDWGQRYFPQFLSNVGQVHTQKNTSFFSVAHIRSPKRKSVLPQIPGQCWWNYIFSGCDPIYLTAYFVWYARCRTCSMWILELSSNHETIIANFHGLPIAYEFYNQAWNAAQVQLTLKQVKHWHVSIISVTNSSTFVLAWKESGK